MTREIRPWPKPEPTPKRPPYRMRQRSSKKVESDKQLDEITPLLLERCKGRCEARTPDCTGRAEHRHHALRRPHTGGRHHLEDLLYVCNACHRRIHDNPAEAYERGWLLRNGAA